MPITGDQYEPYSSGAFNKTSYSSTMPLALSIAKLWNHFAPRGKGSIPRTLGGLFGKTLGNCYIETKYGANLVVEPSSLDVYVHMLNNGRTWNEHVFDACKTLMKNGGVFFDIGANVGYLSIEIAKMFGEKVSVVAFEPQPSLAKAIELSGKLNQLDNIKVFDLMLGEVRGESNLFVGSHSIHASAVAREQNSTCINRTITTVDSMVDAGCIAPPNLMKLDIEGGELAAFLGARKTISTYLPTIIFECDENMTRFGYTRNDVVNLIAEMGSYEFFFISGLEYELIKFDKESSLFTYSDVLAVAK